MLGEMMRTTFAMLGLLSLFVPAVATAQSELDLDAPPPAEPAAAPAPAATAETAAPSSGQAITGWGVIPWHGIGVGGRYTLPLAISPILGSTGIKDYFALEFGADYLHWSYSHGGNGFGWNEFLPVVGIMWSIWFTDKIGIYPKFDLGYGVGWFSGWDSTWPGRPSYGGFFWDLALGVNFKLNPRVNLRVEGGYTGFKAGAAYLF
jgi:hypothetical protein